MKQLEELVSAIEQLQRQIQNVTSANARRERQGQAQSVRREAVWHNLGAPHGYVHPSGRAKVVYDGKRWVAYVDGRRLRKTYRKSFNARVAAGIKLNASK